MTKWIKKVKISIEKSGYIIKMNKFWKKWTKKIMKNSENLVIS